MKPKTHLLIKEGNQYTENKKTKLIAKHYQKQFNKDQPSLPEMSPAPVKTAFTSGEVQAGIKQLQSNKNAGRDNIHRKRYYNNL